MTNQEFLLALRSLRASYDTQQYTGIEYNRRLLQLHADHAAQYLVNQQPSTNDAVALPKSAPAFDRPGETTPGAALTTGMTYRQTEWAKAHDWYVRTVLDETGYYVIVRNDDDGIDGVQTFRDYAKLRAWAGY